MNHFQRMNLKRAEACIEDIINRGKLPIIAGGTGLYIQSLLYNYAFEDETVSPEKCKLFMRNLQNSNNITMRSYHYLASFDSESAENIHPNNRKRVLRAIEYYLKQKTFKFSKESTTIY